MTESECNKKYICIYIYRIVYSIVQYIYIYVYSIWKHIEYMYVCMYVIYYKLYGNIYIYIYVYKNNKVYYKQGRVHVSLIPGNIWSIESIFLWPITQVLLFINVNPLYMSCIWFFNIKYIVRPTKRFHILCLIQIHECI